MGHLIHAWYLLVLITNDGKADLDTNNIYRKLQITNYKLQIYSCLVNDETNFILAKTQNNGNLYKKRHWRRLLSVLINNYQVIILRTISSKRESILCDVMIYRYNESTGNASASAVRTKLMIFMRRVQPLTFNLQFSTS